MPFAETPTGRLHFQVLDAVPQWVTEPETILFHHGVAANLHLWSRWLPELTDRYRIVRFDTRGYGGSAAAGEDFKYTFESLADDVLAVADAAETRKFHFVGESMGGTIGVALALRAQERLHTLILSNAAARGGQIRNVDGWKAIADGDGASGWAEQMMDWRFYPGMLDREVYDWFKGVHEASSMDVNLALADLLLQADFMQELEAINVPTLLLAPEASPFIALDLMAEMRRRLPRAELQVFAHSKHGLPLSHGPQCAAVARSFLDRQQASGP